MTDTLARTSGSNRKGQRRPRRATVSAMVSLAPFCWAVVIAVLGCASPVPTVSPAPVASETSSQPTPSWPGVSEPVPSRLATSSRPIPSRPTPTLTPSAVPSHGPGTFTDAGSTQLPGQIWITAVLLRTGKVLVVGDGVAALYDPGTGKMKSTAQPIPWGQEAFDPDYSIVLGDGRVLLLGRHDNVGAMTSWDELYDPSTGRFSRTGSEPSHDDSDEFVLLHDGRALGIGGDSASAFGAKCDMYDPATGKFSRSGRMNVAREGFTATVLRDGRVLVTGGEFGGQSYSDYYSSAELFNPANGKWSRTGSMTTGRSGATATLLANGEVLIAGGGNNGGALASAELYDPATGKFTKTGSMTTGRESPTGTLLRDGRVLVAGGFGQADGLGQDLASAEIYDPSTGTFRSTWPLTVPMGLPILSALLPDGRVIVINFYGEADLRWP